VDFRLTHHKQGQIKGNLTGGDRFWIGHSDPVSATVGLVPLGMVTSHKQGQIKGNLTGGDRFWIGHSDHVSATVGLVPLGMVMNFKLAG